MPLKTIIILMTVGIMEISCASHLYVLESAPPTPNIQKLYVQHYFVFGLFPHYPIKKQSDYCGPHEHIYAINRFDGGLPAVAVCTITLFIYCPELMGIVCAPDAPDQRT